MYLCYLYFIFLSYFLLFFNDTPLIIASGNGAQPIVDLLMEVKNLNGGSKNISKPKRINEIHLLPFNSI